MADTQSIRVVAFCEGGKWIAQCVEYDIGVQADDLDKAKLLFSIALDVEVAESMRRHGKPFEGIPASPERFEKMWANQTSAFGPATMQRDSMNVQLALVA